MGYILKIGDNLPTIGNNILANNNTVISVALTYNPSGSFNSPNGIALDVANNRYYVTNNNASTVSIIDYTTNTLISVVSTASGLFNNPNAIALDIANNRYYVANNNNSTVSIISEKYQ